MTSEACPEPQEADDDARERLDVKRLTPLLGWRELPAEELRLPLLASLNCA